MDEPYGAPLTTLTELDELDDEEIVEGYFDGFRNEPTPSGNRSKSYWHGWRNGMVDGKHAEPDGAQMLLAKAFINRPEPTNPGGRDDRP